MLILKKITGAEEGSRTPTPFTGLEPESSVSANFTTSANFRIILPCFYIFHNSRMNKKYHQNVQGQRLFLLAER